MEGRRIIADDTKVEEPVKENPTPKYEDADESLTEKYKVNNTASEAMSESEDAFLKFVAKQIEAMDKKLAFHGEEAPMLGELNKALGMHSHTMLALTALYEQARWDVSAAKEAYDEWYADKFIRVRTEVNTNDVAKSKWYTKEEIDYMIRVKYKEEMASLRAQCQLAESKRSLLQRLVDGWNTYQFILTQLSKNSIAEHYSVSKEQYYE